MMLEISIYQFLIGAVESQHVLRLEIFGVAILSVYIISIIFMHYLIGQYHAKIVYIKDNEWLQNHLQYTVEQIKQQERKDSELRILHHDLRHILTTTSTLIQDGKNDKALEFLNQYISLISNTRRIRYCKDSFINAALDYYYNICKDNKIKFNCKLNNIEDALKIPSHEVAVVISNCLENAINASLRLESNRLINFTFLNNNGRLVLKVENNYNGIIELDEENKPTNHEENHGIGTASIQYFAKRNDLIIDYEMSDNVFKITILFK
jgi:sensor histidine kinase regulating citrate/malate metabolism